ncbi:arylformamidase [Piscibacillus halophilus]|uniref:Kynurenine formamidase n=1 Tax=Piscibacillus halophilus TaxID=571933 RepID=A0A1H9MRP0_9BACI|nr:arylformamidase [Piscibacillus halophilus]SER26298.1 Kynurenine formamidase [Piscibacillus halophilus]
MIIDISRLLNTNTPTWPGDTPFSYQLTWSQEETGSVNVGQITTSCHTATHVDAPFHFKDRGMTIEQLPLEIFVGDALVVDVTTKGEITIQDFDGLNLKDVRRVLLKTDTWTNDLFPETIPIIDPELGPFFLENGIELLGVDLPSVDPLDSKTLDTHHSLLKNGVHILEGLNLTDVEPGLYRLTALPLKVEGADGSPVRAILETL